MTKKLSFYFYAMLICGLGILSSCEDDPITGGGGGDIGPTTSLVAGTDLVTSSATIDANGSFTVNLTASQGDVAMNTLTIQKDQANIDVNSVTINGNGAASAVILLPATDRTNLDYTIVISTELVGGESANYSFIITDESSLTSTESVSINAVSVPPTFTAMGNMDALVVEPSMIFSVSVSAVAGSSPLATMTILENDVEVISQRIDITGVNTESNPFIIPAENSNGFDWDILIRSSDTEMTATFRWILTDSSGTSVELTRDIITQIPGTPVDSIKTELSLFNQGGPTGTGGINLKTGEGLGSDDANAHLVDRGIDLDLPDATNWKQQIGPGLATTTLKSITSVQPEGFSFDGVTTIDEIQAAFDLETGTIAEGESSVAVVEGDMFVLQADDGTFILVKIDAVMVTDTDNDDKYILSAKF